MRRVCEPQARLSQPRRRRVRCRLPPIKQQRRQAHGDAPGVVEAFDFAAAVVPAGGAVLRDGVVAEALHDLIQGRTAIMIAHRLSTLDICDAILELTAPETDSLNPEDGGA